MILASFTQAKDTKPRPEPDDRQPWSIPVPPESSNILAKHWDILEDGKVVDLANIYLANSLLENCHVILGAHDTVLIGVDFRGCSFEYRGAADPISLRYQADSLNGHDNRDLVEAILPVS